MKVGDRVQVWVPEDGCHREADVIDVPNEPLKGELRVLVQLDDGRIYVYANTSIC